MGFEHKDSNLTNAVCWKLRVTLLRDCSEERCSKGNSMRRLASFGDLRRHRSSGWSLGKNHPSASMGSLHKSRLRK